MTLGELVDLCHGSLAAKQHPQWPIRFRAVADSIGAPGLLQLLEAIASKRR